MMDEMRGFAQTQVKSWRRQVVGTYVLQAASGLASAAMLYLATGALLRGHYFIAIIDSGLAAANGVMFIRIIKNRRRMHEVITRWTTGLPR